MPINHDLSSLEHPLHGSEPLFFMHIPKTAGTTLIQFIEQHFDDNEIARWLYPHTLIEKPLNFFNEHRYFHGHVEYKIMRSYIPQKVTAITMLREPVERYLSHFGNHKRVSFNQIPDINLNTYEHFQGITLEEFVYDPPLPLIPLSKYFQNIFSKFLGSEIDDFQQDQLKQLIKDKHYILLAPKLERAKQVLEELEFIGLTERFQDSIFLMAYTFGWLPIVEYKNFHRDQPRPYQDNLPPHLIERIKSSNSLDENIYHHGKQLFETRFKQMNNELLERYGTREHAYIKQPLPENIIIQLLNKHHQKRYRENNPALSAFRYNFNGKISGVNWQAQQIHPVHGKFRWSGPGTHSTLILPLDGKSDIWLKISVVSAISDTTISNLKISVNGNEIQLAVSTEKKGATILEGLIPKFILAKSPGYATIAFEVEKTLKPIEIIAKSQDDRLLGIGINWVEAVEATSFVQE